MNAPISFSKALSRIESGLLPAPSYHLADEVLKKAKQFPSAFKMLPKSFDMQKALNVETWAPYPFDEQMNLWINGAHEEALDFYRQILQQEKEVVMSQALTVQEKENIYTLLKNNIKAISAILPDHLPPAKALHLAYHCVTTSPSLARCTQLSLLNSIIEASSLGLEIGGPLGYASLVPFKNKGVYQAKLIVEYKGKIALALRSGLIKSFSFHPVWSKDDFNYQYGTNKILTHRPYSLKTEKDTRGDLMLAYALVEYTSGGCDFEVIDKNLAMAAKEQSAAKNKSDSPWNTTDEWKMWCKTAVHELFKRIPKNPEMQRVVMAESMAENENEQFSHIIDVDFKSLDKSAGNGQPKNQTTNNAEEPEKSEPIDNSPIIHTDEEQKIINNYEVARDNLPNEHAQALNECGLADKSDLSVEDMADICKKIKEIIDNDAM